MPSCIFPGLEFDSPRSRFGRHLQKYVTPQMSSIIQKVKLKDLIGVEQTHTHTLLKEVISVVSSYIITCPRIPQI